jgi:hypothetical protein
MILFGTGFIVGLAAMFLFLFIQCLWHEGDQ